MIAKEFAADLSKEEAMVISYSIDNGFTSGSIGNLEWELEHDEEDSLALIAMKFKLSDGTIKEPSWEITHRRYKSLEI